MRLRTVVRRMLPKPWMEAIDFRRAEARLARNTVDDPDLPPGAPPLPPPALRVLVAGNASGAWFLRGGEIQTELILDLASRHGMTFDAPKAVLDFGCGCGRLARWIAPRVEAAGGCFTGTDLNPALVRWAAANLPGRYLRNGLRPPLALDDAGQDFLYAYSVVTHLTLPVTRAWLAELARVLKPGGLALISFHDEDFRPGDRAVGLARDGYAVSTAVLEGSNHMASSATREFFARLCGEHFDVLEIRPSDTAREMQAWAVLRGRA